MQNDTAHERSRRSALLALSAALPLGVALLPSRAEAAAGDAAPQPGRAQPGVISFEDWYGVTCLLQSCADMLDRHDFAGHAQNFTADALFDDFPGDEHRGRAQIEEKIKKILTPYRTQHFVGTPVVTRADAKTLNSLAYFMSTHQPADTKIIIKVYARYVDEIVTDEASGRLLISKRKVIRHLAENLPGFTSYWLPHLDHSPPDPSPPGKP